MTSSLAKLPRFTRSCSYVRRPPVNIPQKQLLLLLSSFTFLASCAPRFKTPAFPALHHLICIKR